MSLEFIHWIGIYQMDSAIQASIVQPAQTFSIHYMYGQKNGKMANGEPINYHTGIKNAYEIVVLRHCLLLYKTVIPWKTAKISKLP